MPPPGTYNNMIKKGQISRKKNLCLQLGKARPCQRPHLLSPLAINIKSFNIIMSYPHYELKHYNNLKNYIFKEFNKAFLGFT